MGLVASSKESYILVYEGGSEEGRKGKGNKVLFQIERMSQGVREEAGEVLVLSLSSYIRGRLEGRG